MTLALFTIVGACLLGAGFGSFFIGRCGVFKSLFQPLESAIEAAERREREARERFNRVYPDEHPGWDAIERVLSEPITDADRKAVEDGATDRA